jgi:hypothetical protein
VTGLLGGLRVTAAWLGNAFRKVWGQAKVVTTLDTKFQLTKRKLYGAVNKNSEKRTMYCQRKTSIWNSPDKSENLVLKTLAMS